MLNLYTSRNLVALSSKLQEKLTGTTDNSFNPSKIIIPSHGIGHWLTLQIAKQQGIAMMLDLQLPSSFMWEIAKKVANNLPTQSAFSKDILTFRIYALLANLDSLDNANALKNYLIDADNSKRWLLAGKIADVFDQYLLYRDDVLALWEQNQLANLGMDEAWQAALWRKLTQDNNLHRARLFNEVLSKLQNPNSTYELPRTISVFAPSSMPEQQITILQALAKHIDVDIYALSPCAKYWGDIQLKSEFHAKSPDITEDWYWEIGHPLLASLGKCGRDFFDYLAVITAEDGAQHFDLDENNPPKSDTLLHAIQHDIVNLELRLSDNRLTFNPQDKSLTVHIAHSPLREIEILHDELLARFNDDPTLNPSDIAVLMPDITDYAPFIKAVFDSSEHKIPYSLADQNLLAQHPLLQSFYELLTLPKSRFIVENILGLLNQIEIAAKAQINHDELNLIRMWLHQSAAKWGLDGKHKENFNLPADDSYTLRASFDRLILGFALNIDDNSTHPPLIRQTMLLNSLEGSNVQIAAKFINFVEKLNYWRQILSESTNAANWQLRLVKLLDDFFPDDNQAIHLIRKAISKLVQNSCDAKQQDLELSYDLVQILLQNTMDNSNAELSLIRGKVAFGTMIPLRSLPFKLICLLGLNDGAIPRQTTAPSFDLINKYPRANDRLRRFEDRYLLLETLICVQDGLYLSYVGRDIKRGDALVPSVLVNEILETCDATATTNDGSKVSDKITHIHSLQPFSPQNFDHTQPNSFSGMWYNASCVLSHTTKKEQTAFCNQPINSIIKSQITPAEFIKTLANPVRFFLHDILGININYHEPTITEHEPFSLTYEHKLPLNELYLQSALNNWNDDIKQQLASACGYLPTNKIGQTIWRINYQPIKEFAKQLDKYQQNNHPQNLFIDLQLDDVHIYGQLPPINDNCIFNYRLYQPAGFDLTNFWLNHLLANCLQPVSSHLLTPNDKWQAQPLNNAAQLLRPWIKAYKQAHHEPLPIFSKISYKFAQSVLKDAKDPLSTAQKQWENYANPWFDLAFRGTNPINEQFIHLASELYIPALEFMQRA